MTGGEEAGPPGVERPSDSAILKELGIVRLPVPIPFPQAGGPVNVYLVDNADGSLTLFDAGLGTEEAIGVLKDGFRAAGRRLDEVRQVIVSHGHIDHYGAAQLFVEAAGARVWVHPRDEEKVVKAGRWLDRNVELYVAYLLKLGLAREKVEKMKALAGATDLFARAVPVVERLAHGQTFTFRHFRGEILHLPGHTPGLVCLYDRAHRVLFADDHLLARVSPNPLLELGPNGEADKFRALVAYFESARAVRAMEVDWVLPGHGPPFQDHRRLIDSLFDFYGRRQDKLLAALETGTRTAFELVPAIFPKAKSGEMYLMLSEVVGNLEVLEDAGKVVRREEGGVYRFARA